MLIIFDGIDGSGKSRIIESVQKHLEESGKKVFAAKKFWSETNRHPLPEELDGHNVLIAAEPTTVWVGAAIRQESIRHGTDYSPLTIASAYSLDRLITYKRFILPFLQSDPANIVILDRSVSTSLCYQHVQDNGLPFETIANLEGNAFALKNSPDHLILVDLAAEVAMSRLGGRFEKNDQAVFEKKDFLEKARECFLSQEYQNYFLRGGSKIHILNAEQEIAILHKKAIELIDSLLDGSGHTKN